MTDKYSSGLDKVYEKLLVDYVNKGINLLEIGIAGGGSLLMYEKMLPDANVYGFDIIERPESLKNSKSVTKVINQNDSLSVESFASEFGPFDVIIDDGSHFTKETSNCFDILWKHLKKGGIYVIEDWVVGILAKNSPNIEYSSSVSGMDRLVFDIASKKIELGIEAFKIVMEENTQSYAVYKK